MAENPDIQSMVRTIIETEIVKALNTPEDTIEKLVKAALSRPVDRNGKLDGYGSTTPYIDWMIGEEIRRAAEQAVRRVVSESADKIEAQVRAGLSSDSVVDAVVKSLVGAAAQEWRISVKFEAEDQRS